MDMWQGRAEAAKNELAPSRRRVLRVGVYGLAAAVARGTEQARAQTKAAKEEAHYQTGPKNELSCAVCSPFRPPRACEVVAGDISPQGWCRFFDLPD